jgi:S-adenosylmethionine-diacylglycerol 3-amino-3-carboxypropyl transferase
MVKTENFILRYSNCWEDADLLCDQMKPMSGKKICSVASGGENSLSLLTLDPEILYIVDINHIQIFLTELKAIAIKELEYDECLAFKGFAPCRDRQKIYQKIKTQLSIDARNFWDKHSDKIAMGFIHSGQTEEKMRFFARYIRPLFHSKKHVLNLMQKKSEESQQQYYETTWNNIIWKGIFSLFFSRTVMLKMAPDPDFLHYFKGSISQYLYSKTSQHFSSPLCQTNHILHYILLGNFGEILPHYMQRSNFEKIKTNIPCIRYHIGFAEEPALKVGAFDGYNLSNIFEYTLPHEFDEIAQKLLKGGKSMTRYVYWNILMDRMISKSHPSESINILDTSLTPLEDKGWLYKRCVVDQKI